MNDGGFTVADNQNTDVRELQGNSPEFRTELAKQLEGLVPEAITDGKVDMAKLKELLAEDVGDTNERFGLFWPGKKRAIHAAQDPTTATLKPAKELSKDWDTTHNIFIEGDNLEVLKVLQKQYHNAIKMIYIDPPYNTGKDFVYPDNFQEGLQNYLEFSKQVDEGNKKISTNTESAGRYHSNWLNMIYPRLKLARNLLTDDGVIFISISDFEQDNLKKVCNEIFGEDNFLAQFIWNHEGNIDNQSKIKVNHEYVLVFARSEKNFKKPTKIDPNIEETSKLYNDMIENSITKNGPANPRSTVVLPSGFPTTSKHLNLKAQQNTFPFLHDDVIADDYMLTVPVRIESGWSSKNLLLLFIKNGYAPIIDSEGKQTSFALTDSGALYIYKSRPDNQGHVLSVLRNFGTTKQNSNMLKNMNLLFSYPKPVFLIQYLVDIITDKSDTVLDLFSGSGTTAHAVMRLNAEDGGNRKHIQVQLPEPTDKESEAYDAGYRKISDIARERINRAGENIKADYADKLAERGTSLDIGYRTYKLSDTNFRKWQSSATNDLGELQARLDLMRESANDSASEEDLLIEVILKIGLPLTTRTQQREVSGLSVHQVVADADDETSDVQPVFYLNEHTKPLLEQLRTIVTELTPSKFVILDDAFQGDNELKTNLVQTCKSYDVELWTV